MAIAYLYSKFFKKILRGRCVKNCRIHKTAVVNSGCNLYSSTMGKYSYCGYDCEMFFCDIGAFCSISDHVFIGGAEHPLHWVSTSPVFQNVSHSGPRLKYSSKELPPAKRTVIGNDVWIGHGVSIKQGVNIGHGAVIATGAVVTKDVEPYSIVGGCPARHIRYRFPEELRIELLKIKWWDFPEEHIRKVADKIDNPEEFICECNKYLGISTGSK